MARTFAIILGLIVLTGMLLICFVDVQSQATVTAQAFPSCNHLPLLSNSDRAGSSPWLQKRELHVLTYNVQFRPSLADLLNPGWPNTQERAQAIGQAIAQYDIVALQEVFRHDRLNEILTAAEAHSIGEKKLSLLASGRFFDVAFGPAPRHLSQTHLTFPQLIFRKLRRVFSNFLAVFGNEDRQAKPLEDSGLVLLSRYPILCRDTHPYQTKAGVDAWTAKGILHVAVQRREKPGADDILDVFITHLQAGGKAYREERLAQVMELMQFIRTVHARTPQHPILLMGDFNINGSASLHKQLHSSYSLLRRLLQQADPTLTDVWFHHYPQASGFTKHIEPKRVDYIFVTEGYALSSLDAQVKEFSCCADRVPDCQSPTQGYLSDHNGLEARLMWW